MKIHPFQAIYPNIELIASPDSFFATIRQDYVEYFQNGFFKETTDKGYYLLEIKTGRTTRTGLVVALDVTEYSKGNIVRHEQTIASSEQEMLKVLLQRGAMVKPVLLCHPVIKEIADELNRLKKSTKPFLTLNTISGNHEYNLYRIGTQEGTGLSALFAKDVPKVYIADGHHRCSTGEKLLNLQGNKLGKDYSLILSALFSFDQLEILDYNRVVQLPYNMKLTKFIAKVSHVADLHSIQGPAKPDRKHQLTMCMQDDWYQLSWKESVLKKYREAPAILDADVLDKEVLENILGIEDIRTDTKVEYISGNLGAEYVAERAMMSEHHVGFCIYPVQFDELVKVSDSGGTLPPKSTWFEPRMVNGLIVKSFE